MISGAYGLGAEDRSVARSLGRILPVWFQRRQDLLARLGNYMQRFKDPAANGSAVPNRQASDGRFELVLVGSGDLDELRGAGEGHDADLRVGVLAAHEGEGSRLRGGQPGGLDIREPMLPETSKTRIMVVRFLGMG